MADDYDFIYKIIIVGDSGTGKSSLVARYVNDEFELNYMSTIGVDFRTKCIEKKDKKIKLQIWDTAGQERFRTIAKSYYRGAHFYIMTFDMSDKDGYRGIKFWIDEIKNYSLTDIKFIIVGTKSDLVCENYDRQNVYYYCQQIGAKYIESSSTLHVCYVTFFTIGLKIT